MPVAYDFSKYIHCIRRKKKNLKKSLFEIDAKQQREKILQIHPETRQNKRQRLLFFCLRKLNVALNLTLVGH